LSNPRNDFNNGLMITCDKSLTHNVALWSTSLIPKLKPFFIPFWCFMASNVQTVEIDIRDDTGVKIPFERGRVVVTLHCRKRKESYLE
jgi:hypothetical protein